MAAATNLCSIPVPKTVSASLFGGDDAFFAFCIYCLAKLLACIFLLIVPRITLWAYWLLTRFIEYVPAAANLSHIKRIPQNMGIFKKV